MSCDICNGRSWYDPLYMSKGIPGVIEDMTTAISTSNWLTWIKQSTVRLPTYLDDLSDCLITRVDYCRSEGWELDETQEVIIAHMYHRDATRSIRLEQGHTRSCVTICKDHPCEEYPRITLIQSFIVPVDSPFNVLHCVTLAESISGLVDGCSLQPWMRLWWAATFFHCARHMCGAKQMDSDKGPAFSRRGYLGSLKVINDNCQIQVFNTVETETEMNETLARMTLGTLRQKLFWVWSGLMSIVGLDITDPQMDEFRLKLAFRHDQAWMKDPKRDDFRTDPIKVVLAKQAEMLGDLVAGFKEH